MRLTYPRMKIALVVERFEPRAGGVEGVVHHLTSGLARRREHVTVVCRTVGAPIPAGVFVECVRAPSFWQPLRITRFSTRAARVTAHGFDVVHGFSRTRRQHIYRAGGGAHDSYLKRMYRHPWIRRHLSPRHRTILQIEEAVFRDPAQLIQCNSRMVAADLAERYAIAAERLVTIYNGVDTERFHPAQRSERKRLRAELGIGGGAVALFAGHGFQRKGLDRALRGLAQSGASATLLVAGRGDPRPYEQLAARLGVLPRVRFLGPRSDVEVLYAAADLLVLPTRYDAFANACLEAMAAGLPVATTPSNGAAELIDPGVNGFVFEDDFAEAFELLDDLEQLEAVSAAGRRTAEQYTWEQHTEAVLALYARVAG